MDSCFRLKWDNVRDLWIKKTKADEDSSVSVFLTKKGYPPPKSEAKWADLLSPSSWQMMLTSKNQSPLCATNLIYLTVNRTHVIGYLKKLDIPLNSYNINLFQHNSGY